MKKIHTMIDDFFLKNIFLKKYKKIILYFFFGCFAAGVDLCVFLALFNIFDFNPVVATVASISLATVVGFFLNAFMNFKVNDRIMIRFISYATVSAVGMLLSSATLYIFYNMYGFDANFVKIAFLPVIFLVQYLLNSAISFRKTQKDVITKIV